MECTKIILASYKNFDAYIEELDKRIENICVYSHRSNLDCESIAESVFKISARKEKVLDLKQKVDKVFSLLSDEERDLIRLKYFDEHIDRTFDYSLRTYFRKQLRLFEKLDLYFSYIGISDESFFEKFKGDKFFVSAKIKADDVKRIACHFNDYAKKKKDRKKQSVENAVKIA